MNMTKIAYFDFCETLIKFQTADLYIDFVRKQNQSFRMKFLELIRRLLASLKLFALYSALAPNNNLHKKLKLYQLKGLSKKLLESYSISYYNEVLKPNFVPELIEKLLKLKKEGWVIFIVSGGYNIYINQFVEEYKLNKCISSEIGFDEKGFCSGKMQGLDCLHDMKIVKIKNELEREMLHCEQTIAFSDSITDLPLLNFATKGVVVSKGESQNWASRNGFNEIVWK